MSERSWTTAEVCEGAKLFERLTGVVLPEYRWPILRRQLGKLGGSSGLPGGMKRLAEGDPTAEADLISAATIPETYMFRHAGHFRLLQKLVEERRETGRRTRVLSAGCSTGEEVWSIASVLASVSAPAGEHHEVVGWELSARRLEHASTGRYSNWSCRKGFLEYGEYFERQDDCFVVDPRLRSLASFHQANLFVGDLPADGVFDVVFFRNVSIYWRDASVASVSRKLCEIVRPGGAIFVGPSDPIDLPSEEWEHRIRDNARSYRGGVPGERRSAAAPDEDPIPDFSRDVSETAVLRRRSVEPARRSGEAIGRLENGVPRALNCDPSPQAMAKEAFLSTHDTHSEQRCLDDVRRLADGGRYGEALEVLKVEDAGLTIEGKLWQGILSLNLDRNEEALRLFRQCTFLRPEVPEYRQWLAVTYEALGRPAEAEREFRNVSEVGER